MSPLTTRALGFALGWSFLVTHSPLPAQPTDAQFERLATLVESGRIDAAKAGVELLLIEHPDDPRLREIARLLATRATAATPAERSALLDAQFREYDRADVFAHRIRWIRERWPAHRELWLRAAEEGNVAAQLFLGHAHCEIFYSASLLLRGGFADPRDERSGLRWFEQAARNGLPEASLMLGLARWWRAAGLTRDTDEAIRLVQSAADKGNPTARVWLANILRNTRPSQTEKPRELLLQAIRQGSADARFWYGWFLLWSAEADYEANRITHDQLVAARAERIRWLREAAEMGHPDAQTDLGGMLFSFMNSPAERREAREWYQKAADQGDTRAIFSLALMLEDGAGGPMDLRKARELHQSLGPDHKGAVETIRRIDEKLRSVPGAP
jgi:TPR repeat protein